MLLTLGITGLIFILLCALFAVLSRINDAEPPVEQYGNVSSTSSEFKEVVQRQ